MARPTFDEFPLVREAGMIAPDHHQLGLELGKRLECTNQGSKKSFNLRSLMG